jgi:hypothetical protein
MKYITLILIALLIAASPALSGTNGGLGGSFARIGAGARAKAMGNAYTGLAEGTSAIYFNPGALSYGETMMFTATTSQMAFDRSLDYIAFVAPLHPKAEGQVVNAGIGLGWLHAGVGDIDSRDFDGRPLDQIDMSSNLFLFSFGIQFHERFGGGLTAKVIYETFGKIGNEESSVNGDGFGLDAGLFGKPIDHLTIGVHVKDIAAKTTWNTTEYWSQGGSKVDEWPLQYRIGAAYEYDWLTGTLDLETSEESDTRLHAGVEAATTIKEDQTAALRVGLDDQDINFGVGLGFSFWKVTSIVDVTYTIENIAPDDAITVSWGVLF